MKKILSLLFVAMFALPANAAFIKDVELVGEVQTIASDVKYPKVIHPLTYNRGAWTRVIAGLRADLVEDVTANLMFQYTNVWGNDNATGRTVQNYWDNIRLVEGNVVLHNLFCCLEATVGRQFYGEDGDPVIYFGPNHYNAEGGLASALDAVTVRYSDDFKTFTVLAGSTMDITKGGIDKFDGDKIYARYVPAHIFGADLKLNFTDALKAQLYGYDIRTKGYLHDSEGDVDKPLEGIVRGHTGAYGAKLGWDTEVFRMSGEYARNFDGHRLIKERRDTGYMAKVDVAADINAFTARGTFVYAKNFVSLGNYAPGMMFGDLTGIYGYNRNIFNLFGVGNIGLRMFNVGFDVRPSTKWTVSLDGYSFQNRYGRRSATYEVDLTAKYAHNEYVEIFAGVAYAKHGYLLKDRHSENYKTQLGMLVRF